ncbi:hypothetical protein HY345_03220 [Candidatus Microgenomates bacterium]|nr:hypothetical protein [Candidatus Microgenomates bacterium]
MKVLVLLLAILVLTGGGYFTIKKASTTTTPKPAVSAKITAEQAVEKVRNLPEVRDYLKNVPNGIVEIDNTMAAEYFVHVYEIKDRHTATFNWYHVNNKTGDIVSDFPAE